MICPCGSTEHELADHPTAEVVVFHPVIGEYVADDPVAEHRDGEHTWFPDPSCCPACALVWA